MERRKDEWKDGTKTDNGISIQTMPTRNYFTFSMERKSDTQNFFDFFSTCDEMTWQMVAKMEGWYQDG